MHALGLNRIAPRLLALLLLLAAWGGASIGNRAFLAVALMTEPESESIVFHEATEIRRDTLHSKRSRHRKHEARERRSSHSHREPASASPSDSTSLFVVNSCCPPPLLRAPPDMA